MADKPDNIIEQYYSLVDKKVILNLCKNNNLKNLIKLSTISELYVFNKKNKKWSLKSKDKILKECNNIKKKQLKSSSTMLLNLAKLNTNQNIVEVTNICDTLHNKISNIDNIINCLKYIESPIYETKPNIVSFNDITSTRTKTKTDTDTDLIQKNKKTQYQNINLNHDLSKYSQSLSEDSYNFIECYAN
jgi:hypothetical protein